MNKDLKLALIIPTKGRPEKLNILLDSLRRQTVYPNILIILDSGIEPLDGQIKSGAINIKYIHTEPNSLPQARNIGIYNVPKEYQLAGFLDDDVVLYPDALEKMRAFWEAAPEAGIAGAAFNVVNSKKTRRFWYLKKLFFLGDLRPGNVLSSGWQTSLENIDKDVLVRWSPGGATVWRVGIFKEFMFDENLKGYGCMEDIDFSYRVGRKYKIICLAEARLFHEPHPISKKASFNLGYSEVSNRFYFINKFNEFSKILFLWAALGRSLENSMYAFFRFDSGYLKKAFGNIAGLIHSFLGQK